MPNCPPAQFVNAQTAWTKLKHLSQMTSTVATNWMKSRREICPNPKKEWHHWVELKATMLSLWAPARSEGPTAARGSDGDSNIASHSFPEFRLSSNYSLTFSILILIVFQNFVFNLKIFLNIFSFAFHHFKSLFINNICFHFRTVPLIVSFSSQYL